MSLCEQWCPTSVQVTVLQARGLRSKGKSGTNDAYAAMQVGKERYQTSVVEKSVAPVWREEAAFDLPQSGGGGGGSTERSTLHVHVLHRALVGPDKLLGQAVINLQHLSEDKTRDKTQWFKLLDKTGKADKDRGEVLVDIQFMRNNMTASMFDLSAAGKSRSRLGKLKDKVRGKKKESDAASIPVPSFPQVLTDSEEEEGNGDGEVAAGKDLKKKKKKIKSLFSPKSNLQRNMSQSMSVLPPKNFSLSGSQSSGLNVDPSEGKKKFKFKIHKRSGSSDSKDSSSHLKYGAPEQSNMCINGSHIYCDEPPSRNSHIGSDFSLASSGHGSMEDVPESSPPSVDLLKVVRQCSPWEEEEEETAEANIEEEEGGTGMEEKSSRKDKEEDEGERLARTHERTRIHEEEKRAEEEMIRMEEERAQEVRIQEEEHKLADEKKRKEEEERTRNEEKVKKEEEERAREERRRQEEEEMARRQEELRRLAEEKRRIEEEERRRVAEEKAKKEEEERAQEERRRQEEEEMARRQEELRRLAEVKMRTEEEERRRVAEEKAKKEEERILREEEERAQEERRRQEEEEIARRQEELRRLAEERRIIQEEERRVEEEKARKEEERILREKEERRRQEEERKRLAEEKMRLEIEERKRIEKEEERQREEEERIRMEEERIQEERRRQEEEHILAEEKKRLDEERRREEEKARKVEEERIQREEEARAREEQRKQEEEEMMRMQEEERQEKIRLVEQEMRQKEEEEKKKKREDEEKALREKEEYQRLEEEKMKREEKEKKRIAAEETIRKEKEERIRVMEEKKNEEERRMLEKQKRMKIEEEEKRQREEEEMIRKEEERRREEEDRARNEGEDYERLVQKERSQKAEEEAMTLDKEKLTQNAGEQKRTGNQTINTVTWMKSAEDTSYNPFHEISDNPDSPAEPHSDTAGPSSVQQRCQPAASLLRSRTASSEEKDVISSQRERRRAPQPPGRNRAQSPREHEGSAQHLAQINTQSADVKSISVVPQQSVQVIAPLSTSPTEAKNTRRLMQSSPAKGTIIEAKHSKGPAPCRPRSVEEPGPRTASSSDGEIPDKYSSETKQEPIVYGLNPFEDDEGEIEQDDVTTTAGSMQWPPAVSQAADKDAASPAKIKSLKKARAPRLPANTAAALSTSVSRDAAGGLDAGVTARDDSATHPCDPKRVPETPVQESLLVTVQSPLEKAGGKKEGPTPTSRRLQPVKPLNPLGQLPGSVVQGEIDNKSTGLFGEIHEKTKVADTGGKGPYSQLTRAELISLLLKQENQLSERNRKILELEQYIDNLLVRVIEEKPSILMSMNALTKTV